MRIKDIMSKPVVTCPADANLDAAARLMWEFDCGIIPIVEHEGRLAGVVTDRDIAICAYTQGLPLAMIPVTTAMANQVLACHEDDTIESAERLMQQSQIRRVPVLDSGGQPIGILSMNDLARVAAKSMKSSVDHELVATLAAIGQPHPAARGISRAEIIL